MSNNAARILLVDHNPARLASSAQVLHDAGWTVWECKTGEQALGRAAEGPDLVVLDLKLPDFDGYDMVRRLRAMVSTARVPLIRLTDSYAADAEKIAGWEPGLDGFLMLPIEPPVLAATVAAFLRGQQAETELWKRTAEFERERERFVAAEKEARGEAEHAQQLKDEFLGTLSHELRSPLNAIVGWSELLKLGSLDAEETREGVEAIERNAKLQAQMISDLLDVSRITSGKLRLEMQAVELAEITEAALDSVAPAVEAKKIDLQTDLDDHAGLVSGDASRLQQVVWNLVSNAVKFTPNGGQVRVKLERLDSHVELTVSDSGQGIAADFLPYLFERFRQRDGATTRKHAGVGLGLAITKQLVELHGGTIEAASAGEGQGATFTVLLPMMPIRATRELPAQAARRNGANGSYKSPVRLSGVRVLVVDDDADARQLTRRVLADTGAETKEVGSVSEALAAVEAYKPQVLVSDLGMPTEDGFDLIRQVRSRGLTYHDLPAVALTAFARTEDRRKALLAGYQVHLAKPVDPSELTAVIATLVGRTGAEV